MHTCIRRGIAIIQYLKSVDVHALGERHCKKNVSMESACCVLAMEEGRQ